MELTIEQLSALEAWSKKLAVKVAIWAFGIASVLVAALVPHSGTTRMALLGDVTLALLSSWLFARSLRLQMQLKKLPSDLPEAAEQANLPDISVKAFKILCWIFDEDGQVTDERIMERLKINAPETRLHLQRLWERCFIKYAGESLDDPPGYRITPGGTEHVLKYRG